MQPPVDIHSDLNAEDDEGQNWALLRNAVDPSRIRPGAVVRAGTTRYGSVVRVTAVDPDGQATSCNLRATILRPEPSWRRWPESNRGLCPHGRPSPPCQH